MPAARRPAARFAAAGTALGLVLSLGACTAAPALVGGDPGEGFALYRSGRLGKAELADLCRQGIEEILVLDGGGERDCRLRRQVCPALRVRYNDHQDPRQPLSAGFLAAFDGWIEEARGAGRKVAFRCRHGWHRAGRLAAWYRMRFEGWSAEAAIDEMLAAGRLMSRHRQLRPQVRAMADLLAGRPCSTAAEHCVAASPARITFPADACREPPG